MTCARSNEQLMAELAYWGRGDPGCGAHSRAAAPHAREHFLPGRRLLRAKNTIDYFIRVLMPREAWMHRTDIAIAAQRPVG